MCLLKNSPAWIAKVNAEYDRLFGKPQSQWTPYEQELVRLRQQALQTEYDRQEKVRK